MKTTTATAIETDTQYDTFAALIAHRVSQAAYPLLTTDANPDALWANFLNNLPVEQRQHYNCHCCRRFIQRYGGLVTVNDGPLLWPHDARSIPPFFQRAVQALQDYVSACTVTGVFFNDTPVWGTPVTGAWSHLSGMSPLKVYRDASQKMAEKLEEHGMVMRALTEYATATIVNADTILRADLLPGAEKAREISAWFRKLHDVWHGRHRRNDATAVWGMVAEAPAGFCHIRTTMISTLLDDLQQGLSLETAKDKWTKKMHPTQYRRPTAELSAGQVTAANKRIEELQAEGVLARRFATLSDIKAPLWFPTLAADQQSPVAGPFSHLKTKDQAKPAAGSPLLLPPQVMTWVKFRDTVLPTAKRLEYRTHRRPTNYYGLVTAVNPDAPPLLQWDTDPRNPVSAYVYVGGSTPQAWMLPVDAWVPVSCVMLQPAQWYHEHFTQHGQQVLFVLQGCQDRDKLKNPRSVGGGFFPATLRSEYKSIERVLEKYATSAVIDGVQEGNANGLALVGGSGSQVWNELFLVNGTHQYTLDRWE